MPAENLSECLTVADLIDLYVRLRQTVPDRAANGGNDARAAHLDREKECEDALVKAMEHYGPVLWHGQVWSGAWPPRTYRINHTAFGGYAHKLPWPPGRGNTMELPKEQPEPAPEKVAGFISKDIHSQ